MSAQLFCLHHHSFCFLILVQVDDELKPIIYLDTLPLSKSRYYYDLYTHNLALASPQGLSRSQGAYMLVAFKGQPRDSITLSPSHHDSLHLRFWIRSGLNSASSQLSSPRTYTMEAAANVFSSFRGIFLLWYIFPFYSLRLYI